LLDAKNDLVFLLMLRESKNMEEKFYLAILTDTYTARKLQKRLRVLKGYLLSKLFNAPLSEADHCELAEEKEWFESIDPVLLEQINKNTVYTLFTTLENKIKQVRLLTVYVAFEMPKDEITRLGRTLRHTYGVDFLFDIKFDPNIIAGASFVWQGVYKDYSIRSLIDQHKEEILSEFRHYVGRKG